MQLKGGEPGLGRLPRWPRRGALHLAVALTVGSMVPAVGRAQSNGSVVQPASQGVATQPAQAETRDDAVARDAAEYARSYGVSQAEAVRRLAAQEASVAATDDLAEIWHDRLAGITVEHRPIWHIVVHLTGGDPVADTMIAAGSQLVPVTFRTGAAATTAAIVAAIRLHQEAIRATMLIAPGLGADPRTGTLVVTLSAADLGRDAALYGGAGLAAQVAAIAGVPATIVLLDRAAVDLGVGGQAEGMMLPTTRTPAAPISPLEPSTSPPPAASVAPPVLRPPVAPPVLRPPVAPPVLRPAVAPPVLRPPVAGGSRVAGVNQVDGRRYACTTGFVVSDGVRDGVVTAAHCPDALTYYAPDHRAVPLDYVGQWGWGYQDVQVNVAPDRLTPIFYADTMKTLTRRVTALRHRSSTRVGDFVCHRGERTGYHCAEVTMVDFAPAGDLCGGACLPDWVTVAGPDCQGGDSGAPVFVGETAFGIVKGASYTGGRCSFYFYMSVDFLPPNWSLLMG